MDVAFNFDVEVKIKLLWTNPNPESLDDEIDRAEIQNHFDWLSLKCAEQIKDYFDLRYNKKETK